MADALKKKRTAEALRRAIREIEEARSPDQPHLPLGIPEIDRALPDGGLRLGCIHEVSGDEAATGLCAALLARAHAACGRSPSRNSTGGAFRPAAFGSRAGTLLWLARGDDLYAPGLVRFGIGAGQLLVVSGVRRQDDMLWAMEEALRCRAITGVVAETGEICLAAGRRLMLAAEGTGVLGLVLSRRARGHGAAVRGRGAAVSRWRATAVPGRHGDSGGTAPRWRVRLLYCRSGRPTEWTIGWGDEGWKVLPERSAAQYGHT